MKKQIISFIIIGIVCAFSSVYAFTDTENHWACQDIDAFSGYNFIKGYEDGTFRPDGNLTRAEVATIVNRMLGTTKESAVFVPDINRADWFYPEIRKAMQSGVMLGDSHGYVHPNDEITREETMVMMARAFQIPESSYTSVLFDDSESVSSWARGSVNAFTNYHYISGYEDNTIRPQGKMTRAEFVTMLQRIIKNVLTTGIYSDSLSGNTLVIGKNVTLNNLTVNGDLIIAEGTKETLTVYKVNVKGNLILREDIYDEKEIRVEGNRVYLFSSGEDESIQRYVNEEYGIAFSISNKIKVVDRGQTEKIDFNEKNLLIIQILQDDAYYLKSIDTISKEVTRAYDNIYHESEKGYFGISPYILYDDLSKGDSYKCLIIKRDNTVYTLFFNRITIDNLIDNVIATLSLTPAEKVQDRNKVIYKNSKLNLKFSYREGYVGVDDSYNTGYIYSGDAPTKLFIQVNIITDMQDYSDSEINFLLQSLAEKEGELLEVETLKVMNNTSFKYRIKSDDKIKDSLYIVIGNTLYNLIFTAEEDIMNEVGEGLFNEIIKSIEV